jgi:hypothetical protein
MSAQKLLWALLLQVFYTVRSERLLMEEIELQPVVSLVCGTKYE